MLKLRAVLIPFIALQFWLIDCRAEKAFPPAPVNYIYDEPHLLSADASSQISRYLNEQDQKTGNPVLVAIFNSLDDEDLVDYTNRLFKAWNPGQKDKNNGVILAIYAKEHKTRIEVGYGLEPVLTDALAMRILSTVLRTAFQQNQIDQGVYLSVKAIHEVITDPTAAERLAGPRGRNQIPVPRWAFYAFFFFIFGGFYLFDRFYPNTYTLGSNQRRRPWDSGFGGGGFGGGGWGGGSGGGGGFSGGGGSSGGGGASGGW